MVMSVSGAPAGAPSGGKKRIRVVENVPSVDANVERVVEAEPTVVENKVLRSPNKGGYLPGLFITVSGDVSGPSLDLSLSMSEVGISVVPMGATEPEPLASFMAKVMNDVDNAVEKVESPSYSKRGVEVKIL